MMVTGCPQCEKFKKTRSQHINPNPYFLSPVFAISLALFLVFLLALLVAASTIPKDAPPFWYHYTIGYLWLLSGGIAFISHIAAWLIGEYFYVFGYSQHDIHCHKEAPKEKDGKFFFWRHIKVSETEEKNEEVEITTPIMRLTKGGLFKKSTAWCPSHVFPGARNWEIKTLRHGFVELYDITIDLIMKPVAFKDALFLLSNDVVCRFGLWIMLQGYEDRRKEVQSLSSIKCRLTDFGIAVCRLVLDLKDSKEKMRSVIGQKTREALEAGLARLPTADVETWMAVAAKERADEKAKSDKPAAAAA